MWFRRLGIVLLSGVAWVLAGGAVSPSDKPLPAPLIEREEVRFVVLDLIVEERDAGTGGSAWRTSTTLRQEQVKVLIGRQEMPVDSFERFCSQDMASPGASPGIGAGSVVEAAAAPRRRYVLYFDFEHLYVSGLSSAVLAAERWAEQLSPSTDEVMLIEAASGIRIVREMRPVAPDLLPTIRRVQDDFRRGERWATGEWHRIHELSRGGPDVPQLAAGYAAIDYSKTRVSLENLRDLMSALESIDGTKNLVIFADTIRLTPGEEYPYAPPQLDDVSIYLREFAESANERSVRIYAMQPGTDRKADNSFTMLTTETGGLYAERTNQAAAVFEKVAADLSCFYRVGFRVKPGYTGHTETITVRIVDDGREYRVRHRHSLDDPTREKLDTDTLRAAFFRPSTARGFPSAVRAVEIFRHANGSRLRIQVEVPLRELLALPVPGTGTDRLQIRLQIGGEVVPRQAGTAVKSPGSDDDVWRDVETSRRPFGFGRQASLTVRPAPAAGRPTRVVQAIDVDVPAGSYRVVSVVQDQTARAVSAAVIDVESEAASTILGEIGVAVEDPRAIVLGGDDAKAGQVGKRHGDHVNSAPAFLPPNSLVVDDTTIQAGLPLHLFFSVCGERRDGKKARKGMAIHTLFEGWRLQRTLTCGPTASPGPLADRPIPAPGEDETCVPVVDAIPATVLQPGPCRFEVVLDRPGAERLSRELTFKVAPSAGVSSSGAARSPTIAEAGAHS